jgi:dTDP-4-dehydrorhamnose reductase
MRVLITGASGRLGAYLLAQIGELDYDVIAWSRSTKADQMGYPVRPVELSDPGALAAALAAASPDVVIHAGGISSADAVQSDPVGGHEVITMATARLAEWSVRNNRRLVFTSTDLVFDGGGSWYRETDPALPTLEYGRAKRAAELAVLNTPNGLVARIALLYGAALSRRDGFYDRAMARLVAGEPQHFFTDEFRTPLHYGTAAGVLLRLAGSPATGLVHVGGRERMSRYELMFQCALARGIDPALVHQNKRADMPSPEPRPADVSLDSSRLRALLPGAPWPDVDEALNCTFTPSQR